MPEESLSPEPLLPKVKPKEEVPTDQRAGRSPIRFQPVALPEARTPTSPVSSQHLSPLATSTPTSTQLPICSQPQPSSEATVPSPTVSPEPLPLPQGYGLGRVDQLAPQGVGQGWGLGQDLNRTDTGFIKESTPTLPAESSSPSHLCRGVPVSQQKKSAFPECPQMPPLLTLECRLSSCVCDVSSLGMYPLHVHGSRAHTEGLLAKATCRVHAWGRRTANRAVCRLEAGVQSASCAPAPLR